MIRHKIAYLSQILTIFDIVAHLGHIDKKPKKWYSGGPMTYLSLKKIQTIALSLAFITLVPQATQAQSMAVGIPLMATMTTTPGGATTVMVDSEPEAPELKAEFPEAEDRTPRRVIYMIATAYSSDPAQTDSTPCIPALHTFDLCKEYAKTGVADTVATNDISLKTALRVSGLTISGKPLDSQNMVVRDRMNKKYTGKSRIDIWMPSKEEAIKFGVQRIKVEIF